MKGKKTANIQLADILAHYHIKELNNYFPQTLKQELQDLRTLTHIAAMNIPAHLTDLRKKVGESQRTVNQVEQSAASIQSYFADRPLANIQFAQKIHLLSSPRIIAFKPRPKPLTELKLRFLESRGVSQSEWQSFLRVSQRVLVIRVEGRDAQVVVGVAQVKQTKKMEWTIVSVSLGSQKNPQLFNFFSEYLKWSKANKKGWEIELLADIKQLLFNLPAVLIYVEILRQDARLQGKNFEIQFSWVVFDFGEIKQPVFRLKIQQKEVLRLAMVGREMNGQLTLFPSQEESPLTLSVKTEKFVSPQILVQIGHLIYKLNRQLKFLYQHQTEQLKQDCVIFAHFFQLNWLPSEEVAIEKVEKQGLWVQVKGGALLLVQEEGKLIDSAGERGLVALLMGKGVNLVDIGLHMRLQEQLLSDNKSYQYKIYDTRIVQCEQNKQSYVLYEFRATRFIVNQKFPKVLRSQQGDGNYHQNNIINIKISLDFTKIKFSSWKQHEGLKGEMDCEKFLKKEWHAYRRQLPQKERFHWGKVAQAIGYMCRCYAIERFMHRKMSSDDRKSTVIEMS